MTKTVWTKHEYECALSRFIDEQSASDPRPHSFALVLGWGNKHRKIFEQKLRDRNIIWETMEGDDYRLLRDTPAAQSLLNTEPKSISEAKFETFSLTAIEQAFGDLSYLDEGYPKLREGAMSGKVVIVRRILADRRIAIMNDEQLRRTVEQK
jgi:hypothetical protein